MSRRLPFNFDRPDSRYRVYELRDWRSSPRVSTSRDIEDFVDEISVDAANLIGEESDANPLRTFYYNMVSDNDFKNRDFEELIQFACDTLEVTLLSSRQDLRIERILEKVVESAVMMHTASMIDKYRELEEELSSTVQRAAAKNADLYKEMVDAIDEMRENDRGRGRSRNDRDRDDRDRGRDRRDDRRDRDRDRRDDRRGGRDRDRRDDRERGSFSREERRSTTHDRDGSPRYRGEYETSETEVQTKPRSERSGGEYKDSYDNRSGSTQRQVKSDDYNRRDEVRDVMKQARDKVKPAQDAAFNDSHYQVEKAPEINTKPGLDENGIRIGWKPAYEWEEWGGPGPNGEDPMDMFEHVVIYSGDTTKTADMREPIKRMLSMIEANDIDTPEGVLKDIINQAKEPDLLVDVDLDTIARTIAVDAVIKNDEATELTKVDERRVYRRPAVATNQFVGRKCLSMLQNIISKASGLGDLRIKLKSAQAAVLDKCDKSSPDTSEFAAALSVIDRRVTKDVNAYLTMVLRLGEAGHQYIDSFLEDFGNLPGHIEESAGSRIADQFSAWATNYARTFSEILDDKPLDLAQNVYSLSGTDEKNCGYVAMPRSYLITALPFTAEEMRCKPGKPAKLSESSGVFRLLGRLAAEKLKDDTTYEYAAHVFVTRDLHKFEVMSEPGNKNNLLLIPV